MKKESSRKKRKMEGRKRKERKGEYSKKKERKRGDEEGQKEEGSIG